MKPDPIRSDESDPPVEVTRAEQYVLGGGHVGEVATRRLRAADHAAAHVDESYDSTEIPGLRGDPADLHTLREARVSDASTVIVAARRDRRNLLIAQLVSARFDVPEVVVLANAPDRLDAFAEAGHEPVCVTSAVSDALVGEL